MRAAGRMRIVELQVHAPMRFPAPSPSHGRRRFPIRRVDHREIPVEHVNVKVATATCQVVQVAAELGARAVVLAAIIEAAAAVEVPRDDEDRMGGKLGCLHEHVEVIFAVDDERNPIGMGDAAAVAAFDEDAFCRASLTHCWIPLLAGHHFTSVTDRPGVATSIRTIARGDGIDFAVRAGRRRPAPASRADRRTIA